MNCQDFESAIGDCVEGTLEERAARALGAHLATCDGCRALADDLRAIRTAARTLERHEPPARTWRRIAAAVEEDRTARPFAWMAWRPMATAAALLLMLAATWVMLRPAESPAPAAMAQASPEPSSSGFDVQSAEDQYRAAIAGLEQIASAGGAELDPQTADILKVNLTVIDAAIGESRAALESEPMSDVAQQRLFAALNTKVALLQDTVALIDEMRNGLNQ